MIQIIKNNIEFISKIMFFIAISAIFVLAVIPTNKLPGPLNLSDILNHFGAFITLSILFKMAFKNNNSLRLFLYLSGYGLLIEFIQYFLSWRSCDYKDVMVDISAILIFIVISSVVSKRKKLDYLC